MLRPSMQTLKHIVVDFYYVVEVDDDPFFGIPSEFEDMCNKNIIETVTIRIRRMDPSCGGNYWGRLDEVLTTPGWFSLKRVSLTIKIMPLLRRDYELEQLAQLQNLRETQFPRLSSSNSVSFDFEVIDPRKIFRGRSLENRPNTLFFFRSLIGVLIRIVSPTLDFRSFIRNIGN